MPFIVYSFSAHLTTQNILAYHALGLVTFDNGGGIASTRLKANTSKLHTSQGEREFRDPEVWESVKL